MTSPQGPSQTPAGWYPDPEGSGQQRYWDGAQWTQHYAGAAQGGAPAATGSPGGYAPTHDSRRVSPAPALWWGVPAAVLLTIIGSLGKWVTVEVGTTFSESENGTAGDGWITLVCAVIAGVLLVLWRAQAQAWQAIAAAVLALIATLVALYHIADPSAGESTLGGVIEVSAGWGVWIALIGSLALTVLAVVLAIQSGRRKAT